MIRALFIVAIVAFFGAQLSAEEYRSFVSHRNVNHDGKAYSVFEIRPCPVDQNGRPKNVQLLTGAYYSVVPLSAAYLDANSAWANVLLHGAYDFAKQRYTRGGFFTPETGAALEADLQTMFSDRRSVILVTDATEAQGGPVPKIHFMVSVHQDGEGGLPLETRLLGHGLAEKLPRSAEIVSRQLPDEEATAIGPVRYRLPRESDYVAWDKKPKPRQWGTRGIIELKTLVSDESREEDFLPLLHQLLIENVRWSRHANRTTYPQHNDIVNLWVEGGRDMTAWAIAPQVVPVTRVERIWLEAPSDTLAKMYVRRMKFEPAAPGHRFPDPHVPGNFVSLLGIDPYAFETESWEAIKQRPGGKLTSEGFLSHVFPKNDEGHTLPALRFKSPVEIAVNQRLAPVHDQLKHIGPQHNCMRAILQMGNGDMEKGWKNYMSQFASD